MSKGKPYVVGSRPVADSLVNGVREKFKRPAVVAALMGFASGSSGAGKVASVLKGSVALPATWAPRFAELLGLDPHRALDAVKKEAPPTGIGHDPLLRDAIDAALAAFPPGASRVLNSRDFPEIAPGYRGVRPSSERKKEDDSQGDLLAPLRR